MKACLNGVLQMTTKDGWANSVKWAKYGWILDSDNVSENIYRLLENEVTDIYFKQNNLGFSPEWVDRMIHSSNLIRKNYSSTHMLNHYYEKLYL
jgi:glucan phosphorylase